MHDAPDAAPASAPPTSPPAATADKAQRRRAVQAQGRVRRRRRIERAAAEQGGVVTRRQVYASGLTRSEVRAELRAGRWQRTGPQTLVPFSGPLPRRTQLWAAVLEGGPRAHLDGESALEAAGLEGWSPSTGIRVSVPRGARVRRTRAFDIRQTRRFDVADRVGAGLPRARAEVAAVRALLWAATPAQGATLLTMAVQQGLTSADRVADQALRVRRDPRRALLHDVVLDLVGGARTLSEAEFARECRRRGLPTPRLNVRRGPGGRYVVDVCFEGWEVVVEIDGVQHSWASDVVGDALRHNDLALGHDTVLRLPLLGLRAAPDDFFRQIEQALVAAGWSPPTAPEAEAG